MLDSGRSWRRRLPLTSCSGLGGCVLPLAEFGVFLLRAGRFGAIIARAAFSKAFPMSHPAPSYIVPSADLQ